MNATMASISIAEADATAIDSVMSIIDRAFDDSFGEAWQREQCLSILGLPGVWLLMGEDAGQIAGFALSRMIVDEAELLLIAVEPQLRRRGIGAQLLEASINQASARGATRLHLEMRVGNPALDLYQRFGFIPVGRRRDYYRGKFGQSFDALTLTHPLKDRKTFDLS